jgi:8-oxo-dGTP pyrophosphatase MutT (NUDIX family)
MIRASSLVRLWSRGVATAGMGVIGLTDVYGLEELSAAGLRVEIERGEQLLSQEIDGEMVLLDLRSGMYLGLNRVGTFIWKLIHSRGGSVPAEEIADAVIREFEVEAGAARRDVGQFISDLSSNRLVRVHS